MKRAIERRERRRREGMSDGGMIVLRKGVARERIWYEDYEIRRIIKMKLG